MDTFAETLARHDWNAAAWRLLLALCVAVEEERRRNADGLMTALADPAAGAAPGRRSARSASPRAATSGGAS